MELLVDIEAVKDGDEIVHVEIRCGCGHLRYETSIGQIDRVQIGQICEKKCGRCGRYSNFSYIFAYDNKTGDASAERPTEEDRAPRKQRQRNLCDLLLSPDLKRPTKETRELIQLLMTGRDLKLRFKVNRLPEKIA